VGLSAAHLSTIAQHVTADGSLFEETVEGDVTGPKGKQIGSVYLDFGGSKSAAGGALSSLWLWVDAPEGRYQYSATAVLTGVTPLADGSTTYVFSGDYHLSGLPATLRTEVPHDGTIVVSLGFWPDGTLFATSVTMSDS
jgi:hypothetical protein